MGGSQSYNVRGQLGQLVGIVSVFPAGMVLMARGAVLVMMLAETGRMALAFVLAIVPVVPLGFTLL